MLRVFDGFVGNRGAVDQLDRLLRYASVVNARSIDGIGSFGPKSTARQSLLDALLLAYNYRLSSSPNDPPIRRRPSGMLSNQPRGELAPLSGPSEILRAALVRPPPMVVFIDEVHPLPRRVQDSLLKAMEPNDRLLLTRSGRISTRELTFMIATTIQGG